MRPFAILTLFAFGSLLACSGEDEPGPEDRPGQSPVPKPACEGDQINDPLAGRCVAPLGATLPCPEGSFLDAHEWLNEEARVLYVESGATGGDGSAKKPLGSIAEALSGGDAQVVLMLAKGSHPAPEQITGPERTVRVIGACPAETLITGELKASEVTGLGFSALQIDGGIMATAVKTIELHQLIVAHPGGSGIQVTGDNLDRFDLWLSDIEETGAHGLSAQGALGWWTVDGANFKGPIGGDGISLIDFGGSQFRFRNGTVGQVLGAGINGERALGWWTVDGANFTGPIGGDGISLVDFGGSQFDVVETTFREVEGHGIHGDGALGWWTVDGANFQGPIGSDGISLIDFGGSQFTVSGSEFSQLGGSGIMAFQGGGEWSVARNLLSGPVAGDGFRFTDFAAGSSLSVSENTILGVAGSGILVDGGDLNATLSGNQISDSGAMGIDIANTAAGSSIAVTENRIENATGVAMGLEATAAEIMLSGNEIVGTGTGDVGGDEGVDAHGFGLTLLDVGNVTVHQNHLRENTTAGVLIDLELWGYYADRSDLVGPASIAITENDCAGHHDPETRAETNIVIQNVDPDHSVTVDHAQAEPPTEPSLGPDNNYTMKRGRDRRAQSCGDGTVQRWEDCDDGNNREDDGCNTNCRLPTCGDGRVDPTEDCDDGNNDPADGCSNQCETVYVQDLAIGFKHLCGLCAEGRVCCQGTNQRGQLGKGTRNELEGVHRVVGVQHAVEVAAGRTHTCARIRSGRVACWGGNDYGQLGSGNQTASASATWVRTDDGNVLTGVRQLFAAYNNTCAIKVNGETFCWGDNRKAQVLGGPGATDSVLNARRLDVLLDAADVAIGINHVCSLNSEGQVACWGDTDEGALGGTPPSQACPGEAEGYEYCVSTPLHVSFPENYTASALASGDGFSCAVAGPANKVFCWGSKYQDGRLGHADPDQALSPTAVVYGDGYLVDVAKLALGPSHGCALKIDGTAFCWGNGEDGRIATDGNHRQPWRPNPLLRSSQGPGSEGPLEGITSLQLGYYSGCARSNIEPAGTYCFGKIYDGEDFTIYERAESLMGGD